MDIPETVQQLDLYVKGTIINIQGLDKELISNFAKSTEISLVVARANAKKAYNLKLKN